VSSTAIAQGIPPAAECQPGVAFDTAAATAAYLATVPADRQARTASYVTGGYWIDFWTVAGTDLLMVLLLTTGWARRIDDGAGRITRQPIARTFLVVAMFIVVTSVVTFPWTVYTDFVREHQYGLSTQTLRAWLLEQAKGLGLGVVLGGLGLTLVYLVVRRFPRRWLVAGSVVAIMLLIVNVAVAPVFLVPVFNRVTPLADAQVRDPILRMARANGIAAREVYVIDASRQSTRISANVSGLLGTERITLNDNLLHRATLPEIEAVMGHEMGHYVMHHVYQAILFFGVLIVIGFAVLAWGFSLAGRDVGDPAGYPLAVLIFATYLYVMTPVINTYVRSQESAADIFGLNAARQPDGFAQISLKLGEYRTLDPGPIEEALFFDHPSGRTRIRAAMRWKAAEVCGR
jgi:STE24 endopeptidase